MAKKITPPTDEIAEFDPNDELNLEPGEVDPRDAKIAALEAELAAAKAVNADPGIAAGSKFLVKLKDGPVAVVECKANEHPFEAYRKLTGVISSVNAPEITATNSEATVGIVH